MTRPDWCPEDVWAAANDAGSAERSFLGAAIARAIMAEREACAVVADDFALAGGKLWERTDDRERASLHLAQSYGATSVARAIRTRSAP